MDFTLSEEQAEIAALAARILGDLATVDRIKEVESSDSRVDDALWSKLADAGLLGIPLPESAGGAGYSILELCLILEEQGRTVAPVPLLPTLVTAMAVAEWGGGGFADLLAGVIDGSVILTSALSEPGVNDPYRSSVRVAADGALTGTKPNVPAANVASHVLVPAVDASGEIGLWLTGLARQGVLRTDVVTTNREKQSHLTFDAAPATLLASGEAALRWVVQRWLVGLAAIQVGVADAATRAAASYTSQRIQFGKPLSTFQGVAIRAADCAIDTEAMRVTMQNAAWRLSAGLDATAEVEVAKWWAADAGQRVVHTVQYLHGGMGADVDYPVHRYFLWGKQIEDTLGGASAHLARLGKVLASS